MKVQIKYVLRVKRRRSGKILTRVSAAKQVRGGFSPTEPALKAAIREGITAHLKQFAPMGLQTQLFNRVSDYYFLARLLTVVRSHRTGATARAGAVRLKPSFVAKSGVQKQSF